MKRACRATRLVFLAFGIGISSWAPMVPFAKSRLNINDAELGLILFLFGIGAIVSMPISSYLVNRFGSRLAIFISGMLVLTLLPILTISPTYFYLGLTLFFFGIATSAMNIAINSQGITVESQSKQSFMSGFHCFFSTGSLLGAILIGFLLDFDWELFYCAILVSILIVLIILSQFKHLLQDGSQSKNTSKEFGIIDSKVLILGLLCFIAFMAEGSMLDWSAEFLSSSLHYQASHVGIGYALFSFAMAIGRLLGDRVVSRFGQLFTLQMGSLLAATGFTILVTARWHHLELIGFLLIGLGASNIVPILFSSSGKFPKTAPHYALAIVTSLGYSGLLIGPVLVGFVANAFSLALALTGIAALLFCLGVFGFSLAFKPSEDDMA